MGTLLRDGRHFPGYIFHSPPRFVLGLLAGIDIEAEDLLLIAVFTLRPGMVAYHIPLATCLAVQRGACVGLDV